ncbi:integrase core domain-containing protein [Streptomyces sp. NK08204]|uniref:integrase core domain-containing protein n=1 Tax=Streptomyces sp. NK08204 TaxID=2873260 RepID=UPI001CECFEF9|nr:integrase core domain-containing protein [Streptomyces sp. NK08204]
METQDQGRGRAPASSATAAAARHEYRHTDRLAEIGAAASVGSVADSYDNAMAEALNGPFKAELIETRGPWRDISQVERAIFPRATWYNEERLHSVLDDAPPAECERDRRRTQSHSRSA